MALLPDRIFNVRIKLRNDSHANWEKQTNFVPMDGEIIIYDIDNDHKFQLLKIGDGITKISELPFINDFYTKKEIDAFIEELQEKDRELQEAINQERIDRIAAVNTLQENIDIEKEEREEADNLLQENINKEEKARKEADNLLQEAINQEKEERERVDNTLQENINNEIKTREEQVESLWHETTEIRGKIEELHPVELKDIIQYDGGQLVEIVFECNPYNGPIYDPE